MSGPVCTRAVQAFYCCRTGPAGVEVVFDQQETLLFGTVKGDVTATYSIAGRVSEQGMSAHGHTASGSSSVVHVQFVRVGESNFSGTIVTENLSQDGRIVTTMQYEIVSLARVK